MYLVFFSVTEYAFNGKLKSIFFHIFWYLWFDVAQEQSYTVV